MEDQEKSLPQPIYSGGNAGGHARSPKKFLLFFVIFVLLAVVGTTLFFLIKNQNSSESDEDLSPTPTEFQFPTDTPTPPQSPTPESSPTKEPTATPSPRPTGNPIDKVTGLDRSKISIEIQNGSGIAGAGKKAADLLTSLGYKISGTGNADNYNYEKTIISVTGTSSKYLDLLKKDLGSTYSIGSTSASFTGSSDARVIVGKQ